MTRLLKNPFDDVGLLIWLFCVGEIPGASLVRMIQVEDFSCCLLALRSAGREDVSTQRASGRLLVYKNGILRLLFRSARLPPS